MTQTRRADFGSVILAKEKMAYFLVSFFLCTAFISVGRSCSCLPSHPQNEYCNSAFGEYTFNFLKQNSNLVVQASMLEESPLSQQQVLFDCSVVIFWHSCPLVPNYQRSTRFYRNKQLFVRLHFTMKPEMNETLPEQLCWKRIKMWRCEWNHLYVFITFNIRLRAEYSNTFLSCHSVLALRSRRA